MPLFVGGIRDGDWVHVPSDRDMWTVRERPRPVTVNFDPEAPIKSSLIRQQHYVRMHFRGMKDTYTIFGASGMTPDDVLRRLIEGYMPPESES